MRFETFHVSARECRAYPDLYSYPGFYWWYCFAGCLPDSDPHGPFRTEREADDDAIADVHETWGEEYAA